MISLLERDIKRKYNKSIFFKKYYKNEREIINDLLMQQYKIHYKVKL